MKKFYFEITRKLLEKATEPKNLFKAPGRCWVIAEDEAEGYVAAPNQYTL